jgi:hypothetical protein
MFRGLFLKKEHEAPRLSPILCLVFEQCDKPLLIGANIQDVHARSLRTGSTSLPLSLTSVDVVLLRGYD